MNNSPWMRWFELALLLAIGLGAAIGVEALGYTQDAANGGYMLPPAFAVAGGAVALVVGNAVKRDLILFGALCAIAVMYVFDVLNLSFIDGFRAYRGADPALLDAFDSLYWRLIAPLSAAFASIGAVLVMRLRMPF